MLQKESRSGYLQVLLWALVKLFLASWRAEEVDSSLVFALEFRSLFVNFHLAHRVGYHVYHEQKTDFTKFYRKDALKPYMLCLHYS